MNQIVSDIMIELHVPSFEIAKKFYGDLGFKVVWERNSNDPHICYLVMKKGTSILNFYSGSEKVYNHSYFKKFPKETPRGYGIEIIIPVNEIENFYKQASLKFKKNIVKPLSKILSHSDFRMIDPFGFYLRFVERYDWVNGRDIKGNPLKK